MALFELGSTPWNKGTVGFTAGICVGRKKQDIDIRFNSKISITSEGCHEFTGGISGNGYGAFWLNGKTVSAHKFAYERKFGIVQNGLELDHLCRNRKCANPDHLEPISCKENLLRGETFNAANAAKTHCPKGHTLVENNLVSYALKRGMRTCKKCKNIRQLGYSARKAG